MEQETQKNIAALDALVQDRHLQMMKAAIPYLNDSSKMSIAFFIKFIELERTVSLFDGPTPTIQMCSVPESEEPRPLQLLSALREFCTEREQETIDTLLNFMEMFSLLS